MDLAKSMGWGRVREARFIFALALALLTSLCFARHPANIPVARAKVQPNGSVDLKVRFDVLAFILSTLPSDVADAPMNALIDGPQVDLQARLDEAEARFKREIKAFGGNGLASIDSMSFPTAKDIAQYAMENRVVRLPVMMTVSIACRLPAGSTTTAFQFPEIMGSVVLTTEFPYNEPISESVDPGTVSPPHRIPTQKEVDETAASIAAHDLARENPVPAPTSETEVRKQIQAQYDAWSGAYMRNDVDVLLAILAPGYTLKASNGNVITYSEYEVILNQRKKKGTDTTQYSTEILRLTLHADVAALLSRETTVMKRKNPDTGKVENVQMQHDYVDIWTFMNGKWLLRSTATQRENTQIKPPSK